MRLLDRCRHRSSILVVGRLNRWAMVLGSGVEGMKRLLSPRAASVVHGKSRFLPQIGFIVAKGSRLRWPKWLVVVVHEMTTRRCSLRSRASSCHGQVLEEGQVTTAQVWCPDDSVHRVLRHQPVAHLKCRWFQNPLRPKHGRHTNLDSVFLDVAAAMAQGLRNRVFGAESTDCQTLAQRSEDY